MSDERQVPGAKSITDNLSAISSHLIVVDFAPKRKMIFPSGMARTPIGHPDACGSPQIGLTRQESRVESIT
jgi:hypothetical protein